MPAKNTYKGLLGATAGMVRAQSNKTANYTILAKDNGTEFTTVGATANVVFTLPTITPGLWFKFRNCVDFNLTVQSATANNIVTFNDAAATSLAFSSSNEKIGGTLVIYASDDGSLWFSDRLSSNTVTVA